MDTEDKAGSATVAQVAPDKKKPWAAPKVVSLDIEVTATGPTIVGTENTYNHPAS